MLRVLVAEQLGELRCFCALQPGLKRNHKNNRFPAFSQVCKLLLEVSTLLLVLHLLSTSLIQELLKLSLLVGKQLHKRISELDELVVLAEGLKDLVNLFSVYAPPALLYVLR